MPQFDPDGHPGLVVEWLAAEGEAIEVGQEVVRVEGDKTVLALESFAAGVLRAVVVPAGHRAWPHTILGIVAAPDETIEPLLAEAVTARRNAPPVDGN